MVMKKITFNADADLLELAKRIAEEKGTTLEEEVRQWLKDLRRRQVETHSARAEESQKAHARAASFVFRGLLRRFAPCVIPPASNVLGFIDTLGRVSSEGFLF
jgi:hypothetical protein